MTQISIQDPVALAQTLIRVPSVTPESGAALETLRALLEGLGFQCRMMPFEAPGTPPIQNLFARIGTGRPHLAFAGHLDVVPPGPLDAWSVGPYEGQIRDGQLFGRGANDMKGAIAAFVAAAARLLKDGPVSGSLSLIITGDEEGPSINGTVKMLPVLEASGDLPDLCLVGEPTSAQVLGDMVKIGRRGSVTGRLVVRGVQGHVAYPDRARNPIPAMVRILAALDALVLDEGTAHFQPSNLEITTVDVGNPTTNVIPAEARAVFNIRHNDRHTAESLEDMLRAICAREARDFEHQLTIEVGGRCFLTQPGHFTALIARAIEAETGQTPQMSTTGGTSDARFIARYCPVAEFGLPGLTMHKIDERAAVADIEALSRIYERIIRMTLTPGAA